MDRLTSWHFKFFNRVRCPFYRVLGGPNGIYLGTLDRIVTEKGRPWRGVVKISEVAQVAQHFEMGQVCRRGFRPGEEIEVGGVNISPAPEGHGLPTYAGALEGIIANLQESLRRDPTSRHAWASEGMLRACRAILAAERKREQTGEWDKKLIAEEYKKPSS